MHEHGHEHGHGADADANVHENCDDESTFQPLLHIVWTIIQLLVILLYDI